MKDHKIEVNITKIAQDIKNIKHFVGKMETIDRTYIKDAVQIANKYITHLELLIQIALEQGILKDIERELDGK